MFTHLKVFYEGLPKYGQDALTFVRSIKRYTLMRSPFVHKSSRAQVEVRRHRSLLTVPCSGKYGMEAYGFLARFVALPYGVDKVTISGRIRPVIVG